MAGAYGVYLIVSKMSLTDLSDFLMNLTNRRDDVKLIRIIYDRKGYETNRTAAVLSTRFYTVLCDKGYGKRQNRVDFVVLPYKFEKSNYPRENQKQVWYIPLPTKFKLSIPEIKSQVDGKLSNLASCGLIIEKSWDVTVPLYSRETGETKKSCFVTFEGVNIDTIVMAKVLVDDTYWKDPTSDKSDIFRCYWIRDFDKPKKKKKAVTVPITKIEQPRLKKRAPPIESKWKQGENGKEEVIDAVCIGDICLAID